MSETRELWHLADREGPETASYEWCVFDVYEGKAHWYEQEVTARKHLSSGTPQYEHGAVVIPDPQPRVPVSSGDA